MPAIPYPAAGGQSIKVFSNTASPINRIGNANNNKHTPISERISALRAALPTTLNVARKQLRLQFR